MKRNPLQSVSMLLALVVAALVAALTPASVQAGPGDFLLQWGAKYHFSLPSGVVLDPGGNIYVAETGNSRIQKFDAGGNLILVWGSPTAGSGALASPYGLAADGAGHVYVADPGNHTVQKFDADGNFLASLGSPGSLDGQFSSPYGVAATGAGYLYVLDSGNNRVQKFDPAGNFILAWSGGGLGNFAQPQGIALDEAGNVYVADTANRQVQKFDADGNFLTGWGTSGGSGIGDGQFVTPIGIAAAGGKVYVVDSATGRIQVFDPAGSFLFAWGSTGTGSDQLSSPSGLALSGDGKIYVADRSNDRIQVFDTAGTHLASWNSHGSDPGEMYYPYSLALDGGGNVYVADTVNHRIEKFSGSGTFLAAFGRPGKGAGDLANPVGIALDGGGNMYVLDAINRVQKFDAGGNFLTTWGSSGSDPGYFASPFGLAVGSSGNVYVADSYNNRVQVFDADGNFQAVWGVGSLLQPFGVAVTGDGTLYVADTNHNQIQKFDGNGTLVGSWGSTGSGDGAFRSPMAVAADSSGNVYVTDIFNHRVQVFDANGTFRGSWGRFGVGDGELNYPRGVAATPAGSVVYVADTYSSRIQAFVGYGVTHFAVNAPASATPGTPFDFTVTALDAAGQTVPGYTGTVRFSSSDPAAVLPAAANLANGAGSFSATLATAGAQTLTATDLATPGVYGVSGPISVQALASPDLTVAKRHSGSFRQGQFGAAYSIVVRNVGTAPTAGPVTMTETLPSGLTATSLSGNGWSCTVASLTCTRANPLAAGTSYPPVTLRVNVAVNAPASVTNTVSVSGGGEVNTANNTANDPTQIIVVAPDLTIAKRHSGSFRQGQVGAIYSITITNRGNAPTRGEVTVTDILPAGLAATSMSGRGWSCSVATLTCTRSNSLGTGSSYPDITVRVNVAVGAPASVTNRATVSGGGEVNTSNDTAADATRIR